MENSKQYELAADLFVRFFVSRMLSGDAAVSDVPNVAEQCFDLATAFHKIAQKRAKARARISGATLLSDSPAHCPSTSC